jgi:polyhydroxyalkanoate synthesis regulator phasin
MPNEDLEEADVTPDVREKLQTQEVNNLLEATQGGAKEIQALIATIAKDNEALKVLSDKASVEEFGVPVMHGDTLHCPSAPVSFKDYLNQLIDKAQGKPPEKPVDKPVEGKPPEKGAQGDQGFPVAAKDVPPAAPMQSGFMGDGAPAKPPAVDPENDVGSTVMEKATVGEKPPAPVERPVVQDKPPEKPAIGDRPNSREINPQRDNVQAVSDRIDDAVRQGRMTEQQAREFKENLRKIEDQLNRQQPPRPEDMGRIMHAMNDILDSNRFGNNDRAKMNTVLELADKLATGRHPQGAHNTCAAASMESCFMQKSPDGLAQYAELAGALARDGQAVIGDRPARTIRIHPDNFGTDGESQAAFSHAGSDSGRRSMCGQLVQAAFGQQMCEIAGQRDGKRYEYVAVGQNTSTGECMYEVDASGRRVRAAAECPPASVDVVTCMHHVNGTGPFAVHESVARQFGTPPPPGMFVYRSVEELEAHARSQPGKEVPILCNGTLLAGQQGHGLHAARVVFNPPPQGSGFALRNQWGVEHDRDINASGRPPAINPRLMLAAVDMNGVGRDYRPQPGDQPPPPGQRAADNDFRHEYMNNDKDKVEDKARRDLDDAIQKQQKLTQAQTEFVAAMSKWQGDLAAAQAKGMSTPQDRANYSALLAREPRLSV